MVGGAGRVLGGGVVDVGAPYCLPAVHDADTSTTKAAIQPRRVITELYRRR